MPLNTHSVGVGMGVGMGVGVQNLYPYPYPHDTHTHNPCGLPIPTLFPTSNRVKTAKTTHHGCKWLRT